MFHVAVGSIDGYELVMTQLDIAARESRFVIGLETSASNDRPDLIGAHWSVFMSRQIASTIPNRVDDDVIALYCDYEGDHTKPYTFFLGCAVAAGTEALPGMTRRTIPAGRFARFAAQGEQPCALIETWQRILRLQLRRSFRCDYEIHSGADRVDVFVGVE